MKIVLQSFNEQDNAWKTEAEYLDTIMWLIICAICLMFGFMFGLDYAGISLLNLMRGGG